jgi:putative modified peptide
METKNAVSVGDSSKADIKMSREFAMVLLEKLSTDDSFRSIYEANPRQALTSIGVSEVFLDALSSTSLAPTVLADRNTLGEALKMLRQYACEMCVCHSPPQIRLNLGNAKMAVPIAAA